MRVIATATTELREAQKGGIPISTLNPDTDGDGKIDLKELVRYLKPIEDDMLQRQAAYQQALAPLEEGEPEPGM